MFAALKNKNGQGIFVQYSLLFAIVAAVIFSMSTYVTRALQGRFFDARLYMVNMANEVYSNSELNLVGDMTIGYEPYYREYDVTHKDVDATTIERLIASAPTGIARTEYNHRVRTRIKKNEALVNEAY